MCLGASLTQEPADLRHDSEHSPLYAACHRDANGPRLTQHWYAALYVLIDLHLGMKLVSFEGNWAQMVQVTVCTGACIVNLHCSARADRELPCKTACKGHKTTGVNGLRVLAQL